MSKNGLRKTLISRDLRKLQKSRPKRYMNPFLCFAHEQRKKANNGHLLTEWKAAHKGLGAKWHALGAGKKHFQGKGKVPAFAMFIKGCQTRKELLPAWRRTHKGLGAQWRGLDKASKVRYIAVSKQMKGPYDQQMKAYWSKRRDLIKSIRAARRDNKATKKQRKIKVAQRKKAKAVSSKAKKVVRRKVKKSSATSKSGLVKQIPKSALKINKVIKQKKMKKAVAMAVPK